VSSAGIMAELNWSYQRLAFELVSSHAAGAKSPVDEKKAGSLRENKSITVDPFGVLWIVVQNLVEEDMSNGGHSPSQKF
jgi:hypothetical protein